jgi:MGT family glycosyltransferase
MVRHRWPVGSGAGPGPMRAAPFMSQPPTIAVVHFPSGGHIRPLLPLVAALQRHGLRTVQWAPVEWEQACLSAGGEFRALPDLRDLAWPPPIPFRIAEFVGSLSERLAPWMIEQVKDVGADVVLRDSFAQYGRYAALAQDVREVVVPAMMAFHGRMRPSAADLPSALKNLVAGAPGAVRLRRVSRRLQRRYGTPLGGPLEVFAGRHGATTLVFTVPSLQLRPDALRGEDVRFVGPLRALSAPDADPDPALDGLEATDQLIYVSLGTVFEQHPSFFRDAALALAAPGRRVIMSIGRLAPEAIGLLPAGVSAHAHVEQLSVLRRADVFVTHGGFNGVQEGLAAGVPLLLCPQMFEQALNADVVVRQGAGLRLRTPTEDQIRAGTDRLLSDPTYAEAARRLAAELRSGARMDEAVEAVAGAARERAA